MYPLVCRPTLVLLTLTSALSASAAAFEVDTMPPAGLYRVETDGQMSLPHGGSTTQTDNGNSLVQKTVASGGSHQQVYNKAPTTQCIGTQAEQMAIVSRMGPNCPVHTERHGAGGLVLNMQCNGMSTQTTIKRTSETTWTYDIVTGSPGGGTAPGSPQALMEQKMAELERARQLAQASGKSTANMPSDAQIAQMKQQMQQQLDQQSPQQRAAMQAAYAHGAAVGSMPMHLQQRYIRVGETCTPG
ncbi:MAG: hypothetical protein JO218_06800 [Burkholderiales bacterium]|nr:hypothetical protein [Burkholderiales bacterium]